MTEQLDTGLITVGVVGLGLMGSSIAVSLLLSGHVVIGIAPLEGEDKVASMRIKEQLRFCAEAGLASKPQSDYLGALTVSGDYRDLRDCDLVLECVIEQIEIKKIIYRKIVAFVRDDTVIATNTSAIPISTLQRFVRYPERFIGVHWAEPAFATRFMEIIRGDDTSHATADWVYQLAHHWGKEPTLLKKDIRGFITNRLMYAVFREALTLVESEQATLEDVDKAFRYDTGSWITLMGIFRRMDFLGLADFAMIFKNIFPMLNSSEDVPVMMERLVEIKAGGTQSHHGLYHYSPEEAKRWNLAFAAFNKDIYHLAASYPSEQIRAVVREKL